MLLCFIISKIWKRLSARKRSSSPFPQLTASIVESVWQINVKKQAGRSILLFGEKKF